jgi:hypothetical protein
MASVKDMVFQFRKRTTLSVVMATGEERPRRSLQEKIAALSDEIDHYWTLHDAAVQNGNDARQDRLLATITARRNDLIALRKQTGLSSDFFPSVNFSRPNSCEI